MNGLKKAILYSLKPHELNFCGPLDVKNSKVILKEYALGKSYPREKIKSLLNEFHGAISYYSLIASKNKINNYYDKKVVEAYWTGNELLEKVKKRDLYEMILSDFVQPHLLTREKARKIVKRIPAGVVSHHSFHVFFLGSITGRVKISDQMNNKCMISWGRVVKLFERERVAQVKTQKLFPKKTEVEMKVEWDKEFIPNLEKGDIVSSHWGRILEILTKKELNNLKKYTMINYSVLKNNA